jgi:hypothetical protein
VVSAEKQLTMPPQKKSKKNTPTETDQEKIITMNKTTKSLSLPNLHKPQIKNGGKNLRLLKRQELRKQHIL